MDIKNSFEEVIKPSKIQELTVIKHWYLLKIVLFLCIYLSPVTVTLYLNKHSSYPRGLFCIPFYLSAGPLYMESVYLHMKVSQNSSQKLMG